MENPAVADVCKKKKVPAVYKNGELANAFSAPSPVGV